MQHPVTPVTYWSYQLKADIDSAQLTKENKNIMLGTDTGRMVVWKIHWHILGNSEQHKCLPCHSYIQTHFRIIAFFFFLPGEYLKFYLVRKKTAQDTTQTQNWKHSKSLNGTTTKNKTKQTPFPPPTHFWLGCSSEPYIFWRYHWAGRRSPSHSRIKSTSEVATTFPALLLTQHTLQFSINFTFQKVEDDT